MYLTHHVTLGNDRSVASSSSVPSYLGVQHEEPGHHGPQ